MIVFRNFALPLTLIVFATVTSSSINSQTASLPTKQAFFSASISPEKSVFTVGQKPMIALMVRNISDRAICVLPDTPKRVHAKRADGSEPPKTKYYRHLQGEWLPADGPDVPSGPNPCELLAPGASEILKDDLSTHYDLSVTGKYSVYIEIEDLTQGSAGPEVWVSSNTIQLLITQHKTSK